MPTRIPSFNHFGKAAEDVADSLRCMEGFGAATSPWTCSSATRIWDGGTKSSTCTGTSQFCLARAGTCLAGEVADILLPWHPTDEEKLKTRGPAVSSTKVLSRCKYSSYLLMPKHKASSSGLPKVPTPSKQNP